MPSIFTQYSKLSSLIGIGNNQTATQSLPRGSIRYHRVDLQFLDASGAPVSSANIASEIENIKLIADGTDIIDATPAQLQVLQQFYGAYYNSTNTDGVIPLDMGCGYINFAYSNLLGLVATSINSLTVEVKCGTLTNVAQVEIFTDTVPTEEVRAGMHRRIQKVPRNYAQTGIFQENDLSLYGAPNVQTVGYKALHIPLVLANVDYVTMIVNQVNIRDKMTSELMESFVERYNRTPQTGYFHIIFDEINNPGGFLGLNKVTDFRIEYSISTAAPGATEIISETYHAIAPQFQ